MSERYARQVILPQVGATGQRRLGAARVLVVGAGGLGCAVLHYLGAAGVGKLVIIDHDRIEESNLHRQPMYRMSEVGLHKAMVARAALLSTNPQLQIDAVCEKLTPVNAAQRVEAADIIVDAADSFAVTYVLSDECRRLNKILVSASVLGLRGYVGCFCGGAPSYRAVFPQLPRQAGSCAQSGVLGTAVGVMGTLQAHMVVALLLDLQPSLLGQLLTVDFLTLRFGGFSFIAAQEPSGAAIPFISPAQVGSADTVIDLRSLTEAPMSPFATALRIEVDVIENAALGLARGPRLVLCCRTGVRAWRAACALKAQGYDDMALIALGD